MFAKYVKVSDFQQIESSSVLWCETLSKSRIKRDLHWSGDVGDHKVTVCDSLIAHDVKWGDVDNGCCHGEPDVGLKRISVLCLTFVVLAFYLRPTVQTASLWAGIHWHCFLFSLSLSIPLTFCLPRPVRLSIAWFTRTVFLSDWNVDALWKGALLSSQHYKVSIDDVLSSFGNGWGRRRTSTLRKLSLETQTDSTSSVARKHALTLFAECSAQQLKKITRILNRQRRSKLTTTFYQVRTRNQILFLVILWSLLFLGQVNVVLDHVSDAALEQGTQAGGGNLFDSAKDTVISIVKNVLNTQNGGKKEKGKVSSVPRKDWTT